MKYTRNAFALNGLGNDGSGLVAWLAHGFTQLLHTVAIHNDGMPPENTPNNEPIDEFTLHTHTHTLGFHIL